jgi:DNA processing protein
VRAERSAVGAGDQIRQRDRVPRGWPNGFGRGADERSALLLLASCRGILPRAVHALAWVEGTAAGCVRAIRAGRAGSDGDREHLSSVDVQRLAAGVNECGARLVVPGDLEYVDRLLDADDPPAAVFVRGRRLDDVPEGAAVVGSRRASSLGREVAFDLGRGLGGAGVCVLSGAARGIDESSHRGCLAAGGITVAVLGSGIDVLYPRAASELLTRIEAEGGALVSEYAPGIPAEAFRFPARNRLIAALSRAVVIVEGADRSGSMITADHALDMGREVFAVPGPVTSPLAAVPLALIREGSTMIRGTDDLLHDLGVDKRLAQAPPPQLDGDARRVWEALGGQSLPDAVARQAGLSIADAVGELIRLELRGLVRSVGGRYERRYLPSTEANEGVRPRGRGTS